MLQIGDQVVVQGIMPPAVVEKIWYEESTDRTIIELNWGDRGTSRVYAHDENKVWYKYSGLN